MNVHEGLKFRLQNIQIHWLNHKARYLIPDSARSRTVVLKLYKEGKQSSRELNQLCGKKVPEGDAGLGSKQVAVHTNDLALKNGKYNS